MSLFLIGCKSGSRNESQFNNSQVEGYGLACPSIMTCDFLSVPKDYNNPSGEMVDIYYGVHPAQDPSNRIGSLILNFGGPGTSAVAGAELLTRYHFPQQILDRFDIVGMDPRGSGNSVFAKELTECAVAENDGKGSCNSTYQKIAPYLGSNTVVNDIDSLRSHLGDDKLTFLGYSYGTRLGSLYAYTFPDRVRAIVLDSPMSPSAANNIELRIGNTAGFATVADYRLGHSSYRNERYLTIIDTVDSGIPYQTNSDGEYLSQTDAYDTLLLTATTEDAQPPNSWENIKTGLIDLLDNDRAATLKHQLSKLYFEQPSEDDLRGGALFQAVVCTDEREPLSENEIEASDTRYLEASPLYGSLIYWQTAWLCSGWSAQRDPVPSVTNADTLLGEQQILIIGGEYDPLTPYTWAEEMLESFGSSSTLITVNNYPDHGFSYYYNDCVDQRVTAYLLDPDSKIENHSCNAPSPSLFGGFMMRRNIPHPAKSHRINNHPTKKIVGW